MSLLKLLKNSLLAIIICSSLVSANVSLNTSEKEWIDKHPVVSVGGGVDWAPFDFSNDGKYQGIANDYLNLISKKTGLKFDIQIDRWKNNLAKLKNHKLDLLPAVYYTKDRAKYMAFSNSYFNMLDYFFIRDDLNVHSIKDLDGKIVAIPRNYAHAIIIQNEFPNIKILWTDTFMEAIEAVLEHRADMLFDTYASIVYSLKKLAINTIIPFKAYNGKGVMKLHMAADSNKPILANIINKALDDISSSERNEIYIKWLGDTYIGYEFTKEEIEWIAKHPVIKIGIDRNWQPFEFVDNSGRFSGISHDYVELISKISGLHFEIAPIDNWADVLQAIKDKKVDMLTAVSYTKERESFIDFTKPYFVYSLAIATYKGDKFYYRLDDFIGKKVGVVEGYLTQEILQYRYPNIKQVLYPNVQTMLIGLHNHEVDAVLDNSVTLAHYIASGGYRDLVMNAVTNIHRQSVAMGIAKGNDILHSIIEKSLKKINQKQRNQIYNRWVTFEFAHTIDYSLVYKLLFVFLVILSIIIYRNKKLAKSKKQLIDLIENIPISIVLSDNNWHIIDANKKAIDTIDITKYEIKTKDVSIFYANKEIKQQLQTILKLSSKVEKEIIKYRYKQGDYRDMMVSIVPWHIGNKDYLIHIAIDITERIQREKELVLAKEEALKANEAKDRFLANITHEIRTPINAIIGFSEMLGKRVPKEDKDYALNIQKSATKLLSMINEILDAAKIDADKIIIDKKTTDIYAMLEDIKALFELEASQKGLDFEIKTESNLPSNLIIDEMKVYQILLNLISNAIKFTRYGFVKLIVSYNQLSSDKIDLVFEVKDSGIGIDKEQQEKIFGRFEQKDNQDNKEFAGTGLGLYISKKYALLMGGDIVVESQVDKGTSFKFMLFDVDISNHQSNIKSAKAIKQISKDSVYLNDIEPTIMQEISDIYHSIIKRKSLQEITEFEKELEKIDNKTIKKYAIALKDALLGLDISKIELLLSELDREVKDL
jgi:two-component system sensor histidine kinase EvgS